MFFFHNGLPQDFIYCLLPIAYFIILNQDNNISKYEVFA